MLFIGIICFISLIISLFYCFGITAESFTSDLFKLLNKKQTMKTKIKKAGKTKKGFFERLFSDSENAYSSEKTSEKAAKLCFVSLILFIAGILISVILNNLIFFPVFSVGLSILPIMYISITTAQENRMISEQLETSLSLISTSYVRTDNLLTAINENLPHIRNPLRNKLRAFINEVKYSDCDIKAVLDNLKREIDNEIFSEWVETLKKCQIDSGYKFTLFPVVAKFTDERTVNSMLRIELNSPKKDFAAIAFITLANIPMLYFINKDWFHTLVNTVIGNICLLVTTAVFFISVILLFKWSRDVKYDKKKR